MTLTFRLARSTDAEACNAFHRKLTRKSRTTEQWLWEFATFEKSKPILYALALDGDTIVGTQALIRFPMRGPEGAFLAAKGEDTLISPKYWGRDILRPLYDLLIEHALREDIRILWGFNSLRSVFEKIGFRYFDNKASILSRPITWRGLQKIARYDHSGKERPEHRLTWRHRIAINSIGARAATLAMTGRAKIGALGAMLGRHDIAIRAVAEVPSAMPDLMERLVQKTKAITVDRTPAFIHWRLSANEFAPSKLLGAFRGEMLLGFASYSITPRGVGLVTDLIVDAPDQASSLDVPATFALLSSATRAMAMEGAEFLSIPIMNAGPSSDLALAAGKMLGCTSVTTTIGTCVMPIGPSHSSQSWLHSAGWHFTSINTEGIEG